MAKKKVPDKLKIKLVLEVDKALYDKIVAQAKVEGLPGTIEDVLKQCCLNWFKGWEGVFAEMDSPKPVVATPPQGLLGPDGRPIGRA